MTISFYYKKKPSLIEAVKNDLSLEIIDHNSELLEKTEYTKQYVLYSACKYKHDVVGIVSLITYNSFNKECFVKIMSENMHPYYYNMNKSVFNKLTPASSKSTLEWREQVKSKFN